METVLGLSCVSVLLPTLEILWGPHSFDLCPLQQVKRLHLEMMCCSQLFTAEDVSQVLREQ